ncbi:MAG TPA: glycogen-binding domain-containing protein [Longimicrobiales bacterium]|nr:glycogen-binding domain-containing protein [Longimicrobiales bacterium]
MNTRIQHALDGDLAPNDLTREEAQQLLEATALFSGVISAIPTAPIPDLSEAVLLRAHNTPQQNWFWRKRMVSVRPVYALAAAALIAFVILLPTSRKEEATGLAQQVLIQFELKAPTARHVSLAGDFTEWQPTHVLKRASDGVWTIVVPLNPGVHDYAFVVDGTQWTPDPTAPAIADGFGGMNSRVAVLAPETRSM